MSGESLIASERVETLKERLTRHPIYESVETLQDLCGKNLRREREAMRAAERALEARIAFGDGVEAAMKNPVAAD